MNDPTLWAFLITLGYTCGSIPFALLIGLAHGVDLRTQGSGNIGATNCGRVLGKKWGAVCFLLDVFKGAAPVGIAGAVFSLSRTDSLTVTQSWLWLAVAAAAVIGHVFPVWLGFKGGKGVATGFGVMLGIYPYLTIPALGALATWLVFATTLRYVGLASVIAAATIPGLFILAARADDWSLQWAWPFIAVTCFMALLITIKHSGNLIRTLNGTESRLGQPKTPAQ